MCGNHLSTKEVISIQRSTSAGPCCGQSLSPWPLGVPQLSLSFNPPLLADASLDEAGGVYNNLSKPSHTQDWDVVEVADLTCRWAVRTASLPPSPTGIIRGLLLAEPTHRCERWLPVNTQDSGPQWGPGQTALDWELGELGSNCSSVWLSQGQSTSLCLFSHPQNQAHHSTFPSSGILSARWFTLKYETISSGGKGRSVTGQWVFWKHNPSSKTDFGAGADLRGLPSPCLGRACNNVITF